MEVKIGGIRNLEVFKQRPNNLSDDMVLDRIDLL